MRVYTIYGAICKVNQDPLNKQDDSGFSMQWCQYVHDLIYWIYPGIFLSVLAWDVFALMRFFQTDIDEHVFFNSLVCKFGKKQHKTEWNCLWKYCHSVQASGLNPVYVYHKRPPIYTYLLYDVLISPQQVIPYPSKNIRRGQNGKGVVVFFVAGGGCFLRWVTASGQSGGGSRVSWASAARGRDCRSARRRQPPRQCLDASWGWTPPSSASPSSTSSSATTSKSLPAKLSPNDVAQVSFSFFFSLCPVCLQCWTKLHNCRYWKLLGGAKPYFGRPEFSSR